MKKIINSIIALQLFIVGCDFSNLNVIREYYPNGSLKATGFKDEKGLKQGKFITYFRNGEIKSKGQYKNDTIAGECIAFTPQKEKKIMSFLNGQLEDTLFRYKKINSKYYKLSSYQIYRRGNKIKEVTFYPNNKIASKVSYFSGLELSTASKLYTEYGQIDSNNCRFIQLRLIRDSIQIIPFRLECRDFDSARLEIIESFNYLNDLAKIKEPKIFRVLKFEKNNKILLKPRQSDYNKNKINIRVIVWYKETLKQGKKYSFNNVRGFFVQLKKGEKLPKDNVRPIYFEE